ncbi:hypothetical protein [Chitinilyticum aquatile]|uniref:hypothetical protein n=1 Tax=Chitinilyticum aquatile TaxID=362520 RepID=UPI00041130BD|nr:hypothetical protein [Chitinilyticum aquatile]
MSTTISALQSTTLTPVAGKVSGRQDGREKAQTTTVAQEKVSLNQTASSALTYSKPRAEAATDIQAMLDESNRKVDELMNLIRPLVEQQGLSLAKVASGEQKLTVDQATIDKAKADIAEDGEFGVRKVSERILSFAKYAMGNDPANLDNIRDAVKLGFDQAKEALGGALPEISQQTYDTIMAEFDRWEKDGIPEGSTVSLSKPESAASGTESRKAA